MSKLQELIQRLCPDGVEYKKLGEVGTFIRGNGLQKKDFTESGVGCIHYGQIYTYYGTFATETKSFVSPEMAGRLLAVNPGNLVIACTSENVEDVGKAVAWLGNNDVVTGGHSVVFRHNINPKYVAYFFQTQTFFAQKKKYAYGAKVIDIKTEDLAKIVIPVPPLEVQEEIVKILDRFAVYAAELQARKEQYEYYRNLLLTFNPAGCAGEADDEQEGGVTTWGGHSYPIQWKTMGEIGTFIRGNGLQKKDFTESGVGCIHYGQIYTYYGTFATETKSFVSESFAKKLRKAKKGDLVIATTSENVEDVGKAVVWLGKNEIAISGDAYVYSHNQNPMYIAYLLQTERFLAFKRMNVSGTKVTRISGDKLAKFSIPIPPLELQEKIVAILDRFETLVNDLSEGLPAEIAAVKEQYEYYRNRLLTFKEKTA